MLKKYSLGYYKKIGTAIYLKLNYFTYNLFKKEKKFLMKNEYRAAEKPLFEINNYLIYRKKKKRKMYKNIMKRIFLVFHICEMCCTMIWYTWNLNWFMSIELLTRKDCKNQKKMSKFFLTSWDRKEYRVI